MSLRRAVTRLSFLLIFGVAALLIASRAGLVSLPPHYDPLALPDLNEKPYWLTSTRFKIVDADAANCALALARAGMPTLLLPDRPSPPNCERSGTVILSRLGSARLRPEETRCNMAARLYMWQRYVIEPAAQRYLNDPVIEVLHFGSYSCRTIAGSSFMSEHATANAFDIAGFKLKSGRTVSVLKDWNSTGGPSAFLHAVHDGACDWFNLTLSPDYNAAHRDHFHVDMGWVRGCH